MYIHTYIQCPSYIIHTYIHLTSCIHTYIDTYIHTYIHTYMHTYNIHTYIHTYIANTAMQSLRYIANAIRDYACMPRQLTFKFVHAGFDRQSSGSRELLLLSLLWLCIGT